MSHTFSSAALSRACFQVLATKVLNCQRTQRFASFLLTLVFLVFVQHMNLYAEVITSHRSNATVGGNTSSNWGQSITTPNNSAYNNISFNAYDTRFEPGSGTFEGNPFAEGELFLLSQEYLGTADNLSAATPGFLATTNSTQVEGSGNEWIFAPSVTLQPGEQYFFYIRNTGQQFSTGKAFTQFDPYPGGSYYQTFTGNSDSSYGPTTFNDWHFELEGTRIPEPTSLVLAVLTTMGCFATQRTFANRSS